MLAFFLFHHLQIQRVCFHLPNLTVPEKLLQIVLVPDQIDILVHSLFCSGYGSGRRMNESTTIREDGTADDCQTPGLAQLKVNPVKSA